MKKIKRLPITSKKKTTGEYTFDQIFENQLEMTLKINQIVNAINEIIPYTVGLDVEKPAKKKV